MVGEETTGRDHRRAGRRTGNARRAGRHSPIPDDVWLRFLTDSEHAIRASAPREPSAQERAAGLRLRPPYAVGDLWQPEDLWVRVAWRDLDRRAKVRRVGRVVATAAAVALALGAWSQLSTGAGADPRPGTGTMPRGRERPRGCHTATPFPSESARPGTPQVAHTGRVRSRTAAYDELTSPNSGHSSGRGPRRRVIRDAGTPTKGGQT
ncbi:hypothetical protein SAFG77S_00198 [Streptomyces afghaniensis]